MNNKSPLAAACLTISLTTLSAAQAEGLRPDQAAFREIYRELVETNTTLGPDVFRVQIPADAEPITIDELRRARPGVRED